MHGLLPNALLKPQLAIAVFLLVTACAASSGENQDGGGVTSVGNTEAAPNRADEKPGTTESVRAGAILARGDVFTLWERTYVCVSATVDPAVWTQDYTEETERAVAGIVTQEMWDRFSMLNLPNIVPGNSAGERFSNIGSRGSNCGPRPENIFVHLTLAKNSHGRPFVVSYRATQDGRVIEDSTTQDWPSMDAASRIAKARSEVFDDPLGDEVRRIIRRHTNDILRHMVGNTG